MNVRFYGPAVFIVRIWFVSCKFQSYTLHRQGYDGSLFENLFAHKGQDKTTSCWEKSQVLQAQGSSRVSKTLSDQTVTETSLRFAATAVLLWELYTFYFCC